MKATVAKSGKSCNLKLGKIVIEEPKKSKDIGTH